MLSLAAAQCFSARRDDRGGRASARDRFHQVDPPRVRPVRQARRGLQGPGTGRGQAPAPKRCSRSRRPRTPDSRHVRPSSRRLIALNRLSESWRRARTSVIWARDGLGDQCPQGNRGAPGGATAALYSYLLPTRELALRLLEEDLAGAVTGSQLNAAVSWTATGMVGTSREHAQSESNRGESVHE